MLVAVCFNFERRENCTQLISGMPPIVAHPIVIVIVAWSHNFVTMNSRPTWGSKLLQLDGPRQVASTGSDTSLTTFSTSPTLSSHKTGLKSIDVQDSPKCISRTEEVMSTSTKRGFTVHHEKALPPSKRYYMDDINLVHCPVVHSPGPALQIEPKKAPRKDSSQAAKSSKTATKVRSSPNKRFQFDDPSSHTHLIRGWSPRKIVWKEPHDAPSVESFHQDAEQIRGSTCVRKNSVAEDLPAMVKLPGIVSMMGDGEDVDTEELHAFLSELDWDNSFD